MAALAVLSTVIHAGVVDEASYQQASCGTGASTAAAWRASRTGAGCAAQPQQLGSEKYARRLSAAVAGAPVAPDDLLDTSANLAGEQLDGALATCM
ncbi:hypothetical protein OEZ85_005384 [Tetradesmus obliquus]|uniref:Uncharacterized protein n=1 Tax=Tetradesmus obliquus TaxID=3088 RepID=A0ABY8UL86_TETOB|nr:hypothetical protein OEZ85_005384 [Tetradesmus obliquus]